MWNETDLDDQDHQFIPEHLVNHLPRQKENGEFGHVRPRSHDNLMETQHSQHSHLLGVPSHDMLTDAMLGHIGIGERDREQVTNLTNTPQAGGGEGGQLCIPHLEPRLQPVV